MARESGHLTLRYTTQLDQVVGGDAVSKKTACCHVVSLCTVHPGHRLTGNAASSGQDTFAWDSNQREMTVSTGSNLGYFRMQLVSRMGLALPMSTAS